MADPEPLTTSLDADRLEAFVWDWYDRKAGPGEEWVLRDLVDALMESDWLAEHDREVSIAALSAAADDIDQVYSPSIPGTVAGFSAWLRKRGPVIFGGAVPDDVAPGGAS